jgi:hypothetical protein
LLVSAGVALAGVVLAALFLPRENAPKPAERKVETPPRPLVTTTRRRTA